MADTKETAVRIDGKGRITLPKSMRNALGVKAGDTLLFKYNPEKNSVQIIPIDVKHEGREVTE